MKTIIIAAIVGGLVGSLVTGQINRRQKVGENDRIREFYEIENAVHVSPHSIRAKMTTGQTSSFVLVDLRSAAEYEKEHIAGAVNITAYKDPNNSAYDEEDRIVSSFRALIENNPSKDIIVYCYSMPCMTGRKIGLMLAKQGIYVKHLGIGWNEWRYYWNLWNHDGETPSRMEDYLVQGSEPGTASSTNNPLLTPCTEGEFSC